MSPRRGHALFLAALALVWVQPCAAAPQPAPEQVLARWLGTWQGSGTNSGVDADLTLRFEHILGGRFVRLTLSNQIGPPATREEFEGLALYWPEGGQLRGSWFDSHGAVFALEAKVFGDTLLAIWHNEQEPRGRSSYRLVPPAMMEVIDSVRASDGSWREFARYQLKRATPAPTR
jgi:hypothetical protein